LRENLWASSSWLPRGQKRLQRARIVSCV